MESRDLVTVVGIGAAGVLLVALFSRKTSTSYSTDAGAAQVDGAILAANTAAITNAANERTTYAKLAADVATVHDNNQTAITLASNNGATQVQLAGMAENATIVSSQLDAAARIALNAQNVDLGKYQADLMTQLGETASYYDTLGKQYTGQTQVALANISAGSAEAVANEQAQASAQKSQAALDATKAAHKYDWVSGAASALGTIGSFFSKPSPSNAGTANGYGTTLPSAGQTWSVIADSPQTTSPTPLYAGMGQA